MTWSSVPPCLQCPEGLPCLTGYQPLILVFLPSPLPGALEPHPPCLPTPPPPALWDLRGASPMLAPCPLRPLSASHSASTRWQPTTSASPTAFSTAMTTGRWRTTWPRKTEVCVPLGVCAWFDHSLGRQPDPWASFHQLAKKK